MKKKKNSLYPPDWIKMARKDWQRLNIMLREGDAEGAGYFLQQSLEKYLKAFLLQQGWALKKIHNLYTLLEDAVKYQPVLESFRELCEHVSGYYLTERYPELTPSELTCEDIKKDLKEAEKFIRMLFPEE